MGKGSRKPRCRWEHISFAVSSLKVGGAEGGDSRQPFGEGSMRLTKDQLGLCTICMPTTLIKSLQLQVNKGLVK